MSSRAGELWTRGSGCVIVRVRVTVKSSKDAVEGIVQTAQGPALAVKVRAVPADGEANDAVRDVLARWLAVARTNVQLISGAKSRVKSFSVASDCHALDAMVTSRISILTTRKTSLEHFETDGRTALKSPIQPKGLQT